MLQKPIPSQRERFLAEREQLISAQGQDAEILRKTHDWITATSPTKYSYHFEWMGRPIIQYPQDMVAMQEILWQVRPDLVIETGIAHGGSIIYYASILELIGQGEVLGIDIEIRPHNRTAIEAHPMIKRVRLIEGSSIAPHVLQQVQQIADKKRVLVVLDSNHTHEHVLAELNAYAPLVARGSYCVVMDTIVEDMPASFYPDRPWGPGNNPKTAVHQFLATHPEFGIDKRIERQLLITMAPSGYLKRIE